MWEETTSVWCHKIQGKKHVQKDKDFSRSASNDGKKQGGVLAVEETGNKGDWLITEKKAYWKVNGMI